MRNRLRSWGAYAVYLLLASELLLQGLSRISPSLDLLLANRYGVEPYVDDPRYGLRPNPRYGDHDAWGFRNAGTPRLADLVALGDSQTYGVSARRDEAWPQQLARQSGLRVYNMACGSWSPAHYPLLLPRAFELEPQRVLLALYTGNDLWDALAMAYLRRGVPELEAEALRDESFRGLLRRTELELNAASAEASKLMAPGFAQIEAGPAAGSRWIATLRDGSKLWGVLRALRTRWAAPARPSELDSAQVEAHWAALVARAGASTQLAVCERGRARTALDVGYRLAAFDERLWPEGLRLCLRSLELVSARCAARRVDVLVVLIPTKELVFFPACPPATQSKGSYPALLAREQQARQRAMAFLDERGIAWVDTAPALEAAVQQGQAVYPHSTDSHPNALGYGVIARAVAHRLAAAEYNRAETSPGP